MPWYERDYNQQSFGGGLGSRLSGTSMVMWLLGINCAVYVLDVILTDSMRGSAVTVRMGQFQR